MSKQKKTKRYNLSDPEFMALSTTQKAEKMGISDMENAEINALYTMAFSMYLLVQDAERLMKPQGRAMVFESKKNFNNLMKALKTAKIAQDSLYEDYVRAWGNKTENYDNEQVNANDLTRLIMLWYDRVDGYHDRVQALEKFIRESWPEDVVKDTDLEPFYVKKLDKILKEE